MVYRITLTSGVNRTGIFSHAAVTVEIVSAKKNAVCLHSSNFLIPLFFQLITCVFIRNLAQDLLQKVPNCWTSSYNIIGMIHGQVNIETMNFA